MALSIEVRGKPRREVVCALDRMITSNYRKLVWEGLFWSIWDVIDDDVSAKVMDVVWLDLRWD